MYGNRQAHPVCVRKGWRTHFTLRKGASAALLLLCLLGPCRAGSAGDGGANASAIPGTPTGSCAELAGLAGEGVSIHPRSIDAAPDAPAHCELIATAPAETGIYIGLPERWNGRLLMIGNGGFAGGDVTRSTAGGTDHTVPYRVQAMNAALNAGFIAVYTNGGHFGGSPFDGSFALGRGDLLEDLAHRAVHAGVTLAKQAARRYYGMPPRYSYFEGCATGGRQGLMAASRYPEDFDGIAATAPVLRWSEIMIKARWNHAALAAAPSLTHARLAEVFTAVLAKCDALDGVRDGLIADPPACDFDPDEDLPSCTGDGPGPCFTAAEKRALADLRQGPPIGGGHPLPQYWDTLAPSTTPRWLANADGSLPALEVMAQSFFRYAGFYPVQDPTYDWQDFDFIKDPARMQAFDVMMNSPPDFDAFHARGGKVLSAWGGSDAAINPALGKAFYHQLVSAIGQEDMDAFYRLYFLPGMGNCKGGYGPDRVDLLTPLIRWVEGGEPPHRLPAQKMVDGAVRYNRAYCPFPQATVYTGGDPETPDNWVCSTP